MGEPRVRLTSSQPGVNKSLCKHKICTHEFLCEGYNIIGNQSTLRWSYNGTDLDDCIFVHSDPVGTKGSYNTSSDKLTYVLTQNSKENTCTVTNGECVNFASCLTIEPRWNHTGNYTQQPFNVSCEIDNNSSNNNNTQSLPRTETSYHEIEGMRLFYKSIATTVYTYYLLYDVINYHDGA